MDYKKTNAPLNTVTRDMMDLCKDTGNVYETVAIIAKRANQIAGEMKSDLDKKLQEFASLNDNLEEISENREQIEISRYYEKLPKPTLIAAQEYIDGKIHYRNPAKGKINLDDRRQFHWHGARRLPARPDATYPRRLRIHSTSAHKLRQECPGRLIFQRRSNESHLSLI